MWMMGRRIFLFLIVNILVMTTLVISWSLISLYFGIEASGYAGLAIFCVFFGMGGAFISLLISKKMAKWMMRIQVIDPNATDPQMCELVNTVHRIAKAARLPKMPEVGIYQGEEVNAFATGPSKSNSLVAVSTGLLNQLDRDEVEAVLAHEVAHIANGDMVTMTLIQGIINALVMFLAHIIARIIASQMDERFSWIAQLVTIIVLQIIFSILGSIVVNYYSRRREFRADRGGAKLTSRDKMISALRALSHTQHLVSGDQESMATLKIAGGQKRSKLLQLFSTHPPLEERIARLERGR